LQHRGHLRAGGDRNAPGDGDHHGQCRQRRADGQPDRSGTTETDFYFAEGFTGPGFKETLSLLMPSDDGTATVDYFLNGAAP